MKIIKLISTFLVFILLFFAVQRLLVPKYTEGNYYGALIGEYYREKDKNHQVIFLGDCEIYESFSPVAIWEEHGISSYVRGGPQQMIWQSYYLLEDTLRYEKPDIVVLSVLSMIYSQPQYESFNRMNIDGMAFSSSKIKVAKASLMKGESLLSYIFPILRFHDRWQELGKEDFQNYYNGERVGHNGYLMRNGIKPITAKTEIPLLVRPYFDEKNYDYLNKITQLCKENDITLVLVKAPISLPHWFEEWEAQICGYAKKHGLMYINLLDHIDDANINQNIDTYDSGLHLNLTGAEKLSRYFGGILKEEFGLEDLRNDKKTAKLWEEKVNNYNEMKEKQLYELKEYGKISSYTYK